MADTISKGQMLRRAWQSTNGIRNIRRGAEEALEAWEEDQAGYATFDEFVESVALIIPPSLLADRLVREGHPDLANRVSAVRPIACHGGNRTEEQGDNVTLTPDDSARGNRREYTVRRLARDRPDLAKQVANGQLSANAAAIQAGFRKRTVSLPIDNIDDLSAALQRRLTDDQITQLIEALA